MFVTLIVMLILLSMGGLWGIVTSWYLDIEEAIVSPILRLIADQGAKLFWLFLPVSIIFMSIHRFFTYFPGWFSIYFLLHISGHPDSRTYGGLFSLILLTGIIKACEIIKEEYYPIKKKTSYRYYTR